MGFFSFEKNAPRWQEETHERRLRMTHGQARLGEGTYLHCLKIFTPLILGEVFVLEGPHPAVLRAFLTLRLRVVVARQTKSC